MKYRHFPLPLTRRVLVVLAGTLAVATALAACGGGGNSLTVYSGRSQNLVGPILERFEAESGIEIEVRYAGTSQLAGTVLEEGRNSPADVVFFQDAGALGALSQEGLLATLPEATLGRVDRRFRSRRDDWVGTSGRARTVVYHRGTISPDDLPPSILGFTDSKWKGRIGWAPTNGSFQAFVTALRVQLGEERARAWLEGVQANEPKVYAKNTPIVQAAGTGEIDVGFVNHYYLHRFLESEGEGFGARNHYYGGGDPGSMLNVAGVGILRTSDNQDSARRLVDFLLSPSSQSYFTGETFEFPVVAGVSSAEGVPPLSSLDPPDIDLGNLEDLKGTLDLLRQTGVLG